MIFNVIGNPSEGDIESINDLEVVQYLRSFEERSPQDLKTFYPNSNEILLDLLSQMTSFNQYTRISADEALACSVFDECRDPTWEIRCEDPPSFYFELIDENITLEEMKSLLIWELHNNPRSTLI